MKQYVLIEKYKERKCKQCSEVHPATKEFYHIDKKSSLGIRTVCKKCCNKPEKLKKYVLIEKVRVRKCTKCSNYYPATIDFFQWQSAGKYKTYSQCKSCTNKTEKVSIDNQEYYESLYLKQNEIIIKTEKECTLCKKIFLNTLEFFEPLKNKTDGLKTRCRECRKKSQQKYYENNFDEIKRKKKIYREENLEQHLEWDRIYRENNNDYIVEYRKEYRKDPENIIKINTYQRGYNKEKRATDPLYKLRMAIRHSINESIKKKKFTKRGRTLQILGCTFEEFKAHIESQFLSWMNWDNYGQYNGELEFGWDYDHIIPVSSAITEGEVIALNHYKNFQPLCSKINRDIKRDKIDFILEFQEN